MLDILHESLPQIPLTRKRGSDPAFPSDPSHSLRFLWESSMPNFCHRHPEYRFLSQSPPISIRARILANPTSGQTQYPVNLAFREFRTEFGQILDPGIKNHSRTPFPSNYSNSSSRLKLAPWGNSRKFLILYSTPWIPDSITWFLIFCQLNLDSGFEWLVRFGNPWAVFPIPVITRRDVHAIMWLQLNTCIRSYATWENAILKNQQRNTMAFMNREDSNSPFRTR